MALRTHRQAVMSNLAAAAGGSPAEQASRRSRRAALVMVGVLLPALLVLAVPAPAGANGQRPGTRVEAPFKADGTEFSLAPGRPAASIGTQMCPHVTAFVMFIFDVDDVVKGFCYDGPLGSIQLPSNLSGQWLIDVDNQSGAQLWLSGVYGDDPYTNFDWCYDHGFDYPLSGPALGGSIEGAKAFLYPDVAILLGSSQCSGVTIAGGGTTEPGLAPETAPDCLGGYVGGHVTAMFWLGLDDLISFQCYDDVSGSHATPGGDVLVALDNGVPHALDISGSGFTNCISWNHAVYPILTSEDEVTTLDVSSGGGTCTA
jgi:hypothetical protein